jgi:hypothetical protein
MASLPSPPELYPAGTIVSCPAMACGTRLYRLRADASFSDVVLQDGALLVPVNESIPPRRVWDPLACPLCGAGIVSDGHLHTVQRGWW